MPRETDWDELYDPARPTNVEEYLRSEERIREVREWKAVLYAHRRRGRERSDDGRSEEEEEDERRTGLGSKLHLELGFAVIEDDVDGVLQISLRLRRRSHSHRRPCRPLAPPLLLCQMMPRAMMPMPGG